MSIQLLSRIVEFIIMAFAIVALFLISSKKRNIRLIGFILGLVHEPLWFFVTIINRQYAILILAVFYCIFYARGITNNRSGRKDKINKKQTDKIEKEMRR